MIRLSAHFTLAEAVFSSTAVRLGIDNTPTEEQQMNMHEAAEHLEEVRGFLGFPMHIDSWLRVHRLNQAIGGSENPYGHESGWCIDFICPGFGTPLDIARALVASGIKFDQLICEGAWCHISFAPTMRQQVLTAHFTPHAQTTYTTGLEAT